MMSYFFQKVLSLTYSALTVCIELPNITFKILYLGLVATTFSFFLLNASNFSYFLPSTAQGK